MGGVVPFQSHPLGVASAPGHPHIRRMTSRWTTKPARQPPKTKIELREMLAEAVRNTQPKPARPLKAK